MKWIFAFICIMFCLIVVVSLTHAQETEIDWRNDWEVAKGFRLDIDTDGYQFPTAITFVPNPGADPKDPLYFVTELRGKVKVVTNDRSVYTFAEGFTELNPQQELPSALGEFGVAGICLEPKRGYVFVTFVYQDSIGALRNNIIRFQSVPETFSLKPEAQMAFTEIFASEESATSHQIGPCQVSDDLLYVSVGDGRKAVFAQNLDSTLGKVLRMTLDGKPVSTNPFYEDDDIEKPVNYVWAYGLRNPFGLKIVHGRVFVAENGLDIDRFLEVQEGENYLWNNHNWSTGTNAAMVFSPSVGPVQTDYYPNGVTFFPEEYRGQFYFALSGDTEIPGNGLTSNKGIVMLDYDFDKDLVPSVPQYFLRFRGRSYQVPVGLSFGPDGLYFVPLLPDAAGQSPVFRISYNPGNEHPNIMANIDDPMTLMWTKGCFGCHTMAEVGVEGPNTGPPLDRSELIARLKERLNSEEYLQSLKEVDQLNTEPFVSYAQARDEISEATGMNRVRVWLKYRLQEPRFDNPNAMMPNLNLSDEEVAVIVNFLTETGLTETDVTVSDETFLDWLKRTLTARPPQPRYRHVGVAFLVGLGLGFSVVIVKSRQSHK